MKIVRIIKDTDSLLSVYNEDEEVSEFRSVFYKWNNVQQLYEFFKANKNDLKGLSIESAIERTIEDAEQLEQLIKETAINDYDNLQTIFKALSPSEYRFKSYQKEKAYGTVRNSWLRIYAIRIHENLYVITGGAIKLTRSMQERPHTNEELNRLNAVRNYLQQLGFNENDVEDLEIEL
ncbi:MAG: hypothetical protein LAT80_13070 [Balneolaceae bacterium]|nr:hypothetical protein [Balneolaceae bacterium]